jgi:hypothetical protein
MDKEELEKRIIAAEEGKQVFKSEVLQNAITYRKAQIFQAFCETGADEQDVRDEAWRTMQNMEALERYFERILEGGEIARKELKSMADDGMIG